jgi:L-lactate dehydrogenase complex protein LldG
VAVQASSSLWSTFTAKAELLGAAVMRAASREAALGLLRETAGEFACTASVAGRYPSIATSGTARRTQEVVAPGVLAVAETGSVVLDEPAEDRGRCFLAERLWLLVLESDLVPNLDVALARIGELIKNGSPHPVLMSGPSRTADIERVLTIGVHGPRAVVVLVVGDAL